MDRWSCQQRQRCRYPNCKLTQRRTIHGSPIQHGYDCIVAMRQLRPGRTPNSANPVSRCHQLARSFGTLHCRSLVAGGMTTAKAAQSLTRSHQASYRSSRASCRISRLVADFSRIPLRRSVRFCTPSAAQEARQVRIRRADSRLAPRAMAEGFGFEWFIVGSEAMSERRAGGFIAERSKIERNNVERNRAVDANCTCPGSEPDSFRYLTSAAASLAGR